MLLDQVSLLTAIAFSAAALTLTLFVGWLGARRDQFLLSWASGLVLVMIGVVALRMMGEGYSPVVEFVSFGLILIGFTFVYAGALQFRSRPIVLSTISSISVGLVAVMGAAFIAGFSGVGTIIANLGMALLMAMSGQQHWIGRAEARVPMTLNALLYGATAFSFLLCALALALNGQWVLEAHPSNWAEDINSIMVIIGITGIGAISLALNQHRSARHHQREAMTDPLTSLLNRRALFERLTTGTLPAGTAVIMFDLDHFKTINDRLGHAGGDSVLAGFADLLRANIRTDDMAARLGGEEFCVVLRDLTSRSAAGVAERIRAAFEVSSVGSTREAVDTTVSAGVAISGLDGEPFEDVLRRADDALYGAKSAGRNRVHAPGPRLVA